MSIMRRRIATTLFSFLGKYFFISHKYLLNILFYEGDITCRIEAKEHKKNRKIFYNIYSLPAISRLYNEEGYSLIKAISFEIDIDINKPDNLDIMSTYTRKLVVDKTSQERIQISGPLLMNWYMLLIKKN